MWVIRAMGHFPAFPERLQRQKEMKYLKASLGIMQYRMSDRSKHQQIATG